MVEVDRTKLKQLCQRHGISFVAIFGSQAQGLPSIESDIDIAVWTRADRIDEVYEMNLLAAMVNLFERDGIDLVILNFADPLLQYEVATKGKLIYERKPASFNRFQVYAMKRNNEGRKFYKLDRAYIERFLKGVRSNAIRRCHPPQIGEVSRISD